MSCLPLLAPILFSDDTKTATSPPWLPAVPTPTEIIVTDITSNSVTVTFRESRSADGFFRDRGVDF